MRSLHVALRVTDVERSVAFYTALGYDVVGAVPSTEIGSLTMLQLPGDEFVSLELVHDPAAGRVLPGGLHHLVVQDDDLHATVARLRSRGVEVSTPGPPDGADDVMTSWTSDPDGYRIELVQWPSGHAAGMTRADFPTPEPGAGAEPT